MASLSVRPHKNWNHSGLPDGVMSVIMSVMKINHAARKKAQVDKALGVFPGVFTVRDMNRNTATVLAACRQHGRVVVRNRTGEQFAVTLLKPGNVTAALKPELAERVQDHLERMRVHRERMRAMKVRGPTTPEGMERLNRILAGEV